MDNEAQTSSQWRSIVLHLTTALNTQMAEITRLRAENVRLSGELARLNAPEVSLEPKPFNCKAVHLEKGTCRPR
jgi:hypothetical protein